MNTRTWTYAFRKSIIGWRLLHARPAHGKRLYANELPPHVREAAYLNAHGCVADTEADELLTHCALTGEGAPETGATYRRTTEGRVFVTISLPKTPKPSERLTPAQEAALKELDAYGHLHWTAGNEDWIACFDAILVGKHIAYHVVVDCESGGFTDTLESGIVPATEEGVRNLRSLPDYWGGICQGHYLDTDEYGPVEIDEAEWNEHLNGLLRPRN